MLGLNETTLTLLSAAWKTRTGFISNAEFKKYSRVPKIKRSGSLNFYYYDFYAWITFPEPTYLPSTLESSSFWIISSTLSTADSTLSTTCSTFSTASSTLSTNSLTLSTTPSTLSTTLSTNSTSSTFSKTSSTTSSILLANKYPEWKKLNFVY